MNVVEVFCEVDFPVLHCDSVSFEFFDHFCDLSGVVATITTNRPVTLHDSVAWNVLRLVILL